MDKQTVTASIDDRPLTGIPAEFQPRIDPEGKTTKSDVVDLGARGLLLIAFIVYRLFHRKHNILAESVSVALAAAVSWALIRKFQTTLQRYRDGEKKTT